MLNGMLFVIAVIGYITLSAVSSAKKYEGIKKATEVEEKKEGEVK